MLLRGVVDDEIHDDADVLFLGSFRQVVEISQGSIHWIDVLVIGNVIAEIDLRRRIARSDPDGIHTQFLQIIQLGLDPLEIADAISVAVGETSRIDFIENGMLPPCVAFSVHGPTLPLRLGKRKWKAHTYD